MSSSLVVQLEIKDVGIFIEQYKSQKKITVSALYALRVSHNNMWRKSLFEVIAQGTTFY